MTSVIARLVCLASVLGAASVCLGQHPSPEWLASWPTWRGPLLSGVGGSDADPPTKWSETENVKWKVEIPGTGSATPIVWKDRIYLLTAVEVAGADQGAASAPETARGARGGREGEQEGREGAQGRRGRGQQGGRGGGGRGGRSAPTNPYQFVVMCLDLETGMTLWSKVAAERVPHEGGHPTNTFASGSPVTDGKHLFVSFGSFGVYCFDLEGNLKWERDLGRMRTRNSFGEGGSPALYNDTLVVPWDHDGPSKLFALDAGTGEIRWQVDRDELSTWATPVITEHEGRVQVITNGSNRVRSYDLNTGELIWECGGQASNPIPTPIVENDIAYCMTGYQAFAVYAIPLSSRGDVTGSDAIAWRVTDAGPYVSSGVLYQGQLYFTKDRLGVLVSVDAATGERLIDPVRLPGINTMYSSLAAANGRIYATGREGTTVVLKHGRELEILATNRLDEGFDASAVFIGKKLLLRGPKHLYCLEEE